MLGVVCSDAGIWETAPFLKSLILWLEYEPKDPCGVDLSAGLCFLHSASPFFTSLVLG